MRNVKPWRGAVTTKLITSVGIVMSISLLGAQQLQIGSQVPGFTLRHPDNRRLTDSDLKGNVTVVAFISTRCPMSNAHNDRLNALYNEFAGRVKFVVVNSNFNEPPDEVREHSRAVGFEFPVYKDLNNVVADLFGAQSTPEVFVLDSSGRISYHGGIDDSPNPVRVKNPHLRLAIEAVIEGRPVGVPEAKAFGCSIKRLKVQSH